MTPVEPYNIIVKYGELEMQALPWRSVFTLMYKEKCKWCENDRTDGFHICSIWTAFGYQSNIVKFKEVTFNENFYGQPGNN